MLFFEDFSIGQKFELGPYTVSEEEILEFAHKYDPQYFHIDPEKAKSSMFGGLVASGWHTASIAMRLYVDKILNNAAGMGSPGIDELRWKRPLRPGDTLSGSFEVLEKRVFRSGIGIATGSFKMYNQDEKLVISFTGKGLFAMKNP